MSRKDHVLHYDDASCPISQITNWWKILVESYFKSYRSVNNGVDRSIVLYPQKGVIEALNSPIQQPLKYCSKLEFKSKITNNTTLTTKNEVWVYYSNNNKDIYYLSDDFNYEKILTLIKDWAKFASEDVYITPKSKLLLYDLVKNTPTSNLYGSLTNFSDEEHATKFKTFQDINLWTSQILGANYTKFSQEQLFGNNFYNKLWPYTSNASINALQNVWDEASKNVALKYWKTLPHNDTVSLPIQSRSLAYLKDTVVLIYKTFVENLSIGVTKWFHSNPFVTWTKEQLNAFINIYLKRFEYFADIDQLYKLQDLKDFRITYNHQKYLCWIDYIYDITSDTNWQKFKDTKCSQTADKRLYKDTLAKIRKNDSYLAQLNFKKQQWFKQTIPTWELTMNKSKDLESKLENEINKIKENNTDSHTLDFINMHPYLRQYFDLNPWPSYNQWVNLLKDYMFGVRHSQIAINDYWNCYDINNFPYSARNTHPDFKYSKHYLKLNGFIQLTNPNTSIRSKYYKSLNKDLLEKGEYWYHEDDFFHVFRSFPDGSKPIVINFLLNRNIEKYTEHHFQMAMNLDNAINIKKYDLATKVLNHTILARQTLKDYNFYYSNVNLWMNNQIQITKKKISRKYSDVIVNVKYNYLDSYFTFFSKTKLTNTKLYHEVFPIEFNTYLNKLKDPVNHIVYKEYSDLHFLKANIDTLNKDLYTLKASSLAIAETGKKHQENEDYVFNNHYIATYQAKTLSYDKYHFLLHLLDTAKTEYHKLLNLTTPKFAINHVLNSTPNHYLYYGARNSSYFNQFKITSDYKYSSKLWIMALISKYAYMNVFARKRGYCNWEAAKNERCDAAVLGVLNRLIAEEWKQKAFELAIAKEQQEEERIAHLHSIFLKYKLDYSKIYATKEVAQQVLKNKDRFNPDLIDQQAYTTQFIIPLFVVYYDINTNIYNTYNAHRFAIESNLFNKYVSLCYSDTIIANFDWLTVLPETQDIAYGKVPHVKYDSNMFRRYEILETTGFEYIKQAVNLWMWKVIRHSSSSYSSQYNNVLNTRRIALDQNKAMTGFDNVYTNKFLYGYEQDTSKGIGMLYDLKYATLDNFNKLINRLSSELEARKRHSSILFEPLTTRVNNPNFDSIVESLSKPELASFLFFTKLMLAAAKQIYLEWLGPVSKKFLAICDTSELLKGMIPSRDYILQAWDDATKDFSLEKFFKEIRDTYNLDHLDQFMALKQMFARWVTIVRQTEQLEEWHYDNYSFSEKYARVLDDMFANKDVILPKKRIPNYEAMSNLNTKLKYYSIAWRLDKYLDPSHDQGGTNFI